MMSLYLKYLKKTAKNRHASLNHENKQLVAYRRHFEKKERECAQQYAITKLYLNRCMRNTIINYSIYIWETEGRVTVSIPTGNPRQGLSCL